MEKLIQICRKRIEDKLQWGNSEQWTSQDFELLSEKIFEKTQVRLSVTTLKRIWGKVRYESSPNAATLNALAKYMGYENWRNFRARYAIIDNSQQVLEAGDRRIASAGRKNRMPRAVLVVTPVVLVILVLLSFLLIPGKEPVSSYPQNNAALDNEDLKPLFTSHKTSDDLPNSVVFHYDASMYNSDQVYIQQNWDPERREKVDAKGSYHTSIYYYPGYFASKLIVDGQVKAEDVVFIKTKGWKGMIDLAPVPAYLHEKEIKRGGTLGITPKLFAEKTGASVFNNTWSTFHYVKEFDGLTGDNFSFEAKLRNTSATEEAVCRKVAVYVLGSVSAVIVPLTDKGCISDVGMLTGSRWVDGKQADLSAFGCEFAEFERLKFGVANNKFEVMLNDEMIFSEAVSQTIGDIIGLRFAFEGAGEVNDVKLSGPAGVVYEEVF